MCTLYAVYARQASQSQGTEQTKITYAALQIQLYRVQSRVQSTHSVYELSPNAGSSPAWNCVVEVCYIPS